MSVIGFGSWDDMQAFLRQQAAAATAAMTDVQRLMLDGRKHYFRVYEAPMDVTVYGFIFDLDDLHADGLAKYDKEEADAENEALRSQLPGGRVFTRSYSIWEPDGELGYQHACSLTEISEDEFLDAAARRWADEDPEREYEDSVEEYDLAQEDGL